MSDLPDTAALMASLLNLMTRFSIAGCPRQAALIGRQLAMLQRYPDGAIDPLLKQVGQRLEQEWLQLRHAIADDSPPNDTRILH